MHLQSFDREFLIADGAPAKLLIVDKPLVFTDRPSRGRTSSPAFRGVPFPLQLMGGYVEEHPSDFPLHLHTDFAPFPSFSRCHALRLSHAVSLSACIYARPRVFHLI